MHVFNVTAVLYRIIGAIACMYTHTHNVSPSARCTAGVMTLVTLNGCPDVLESRAYMISPL